MSHLNAAIERIKKNVAKELSEEAIEGACRAVGYRWRRRELGPAVTVWAFLLQVLHGNTACGHVVRLARLGCSATAYCRARMRLPVAALERLLQETTAAARRGTAEPRWQGHRTFLVDGTGISMPDTDVLRAHFGTPSGCGFPVAHLLALFDAATGLLIQTWASPLYTHDMQHVAQLHPALRANDVLVGDKAFGSYAHFALLLQHQLHGVFRAHQRLLISFRRDRRLTGKLPRGTTATHAKARLLRKLGRFDQLVEYPRKQFTRPDWMSREDWQALPETLIVRELRYWTHQRGFRTRSVTLVTTLLDADRYPLEELAALYGRRWGVETNFAHLKTTMKMDVLRCETVAGIHKELLIFALAYNLVRLVLLAAAAEQNVPLAQLSFIDALRWLTDPRPHNTPLTITIHPARRPRCEPRVRKRRPKSYPLMTAPRQTLRNQLMQKRVRA